MNKRQRIRLSLIFIMSLLFPAFFYYMSPYLVIFATLDGIVSGSIMLFCLQFLCALFWDDPFAAGYVQPVVFRRSSLVCPPKKLRG